MPRRLSTAVEKWPIAGAFTIARGAKTEAIVVIVEIEENGAVGRGECVPYARYGESPESVLTQVDSVRGLIERGGSGRDLLMALPAGAARNAVDCALWDLAAKATGTPAWALAGLPEPVTPVTAFTISLGTPEAMAMAARAAAHRKVLKLKLGGGDGLDRERAAAVRMATPGAILIVDANEGWSLAQLTELAGPLAELGVRLIEQPLPADADTGLEGFSSPVPLCADESCHGVDGLPALARRYQAVNVKLDKTGGLTAAIQVIAAARELDLKLMVGCMVATSLAMAPALLLAGVADYVDLDGPLLLARDRDPGLRYESDGSIMPAPAALWG
jgi:L-alanine-DL-glutamate epimerase-like enolase superfamily enzyme